jgi:hypothetical protein
VPETELLEGAVVSEAEGAETVPAEIEFDEGAVVSEAEGVEIFLAEIDFCFGGLRERLLDSLHSAGLAVVVITFLRP